MFDKPIFCAIIYPEQNKQAQTQQKKGDKHMKQFLIFGVFFQLLKGKRTAQEIAQIYEVSPRTIYRYIDALCLAGIPIICRQGKGGGIYIDQSFDYGEYVSKYVVSNNKKDTPSYKTL